MHTHTLISLCIITLLSPALPCTNFLISGSATIDGSSIISYASDGTHMYGAMAFYPAADHPPGSMRSIHEWVGGKYLGEIPEAPHTYNVIGNMNEFQVSIGETTFGGLDILASQAGAILDYGSLIYIALQRSRSAGEVITVIDELTGKYGYASDGESFSIADGKEVWYMEMIGKGDGYTGMVWVALKVPDGQVSAHANQARIRKFPLNHTHCRYSPDVVSFAKSKGFYPPESPDADFSFSDTYNPVTYTSARLCEGRVWGFFRRVGDTKEMDTYLDYITGGNLSHRMPVFITPTHKLSVKDVLKYMRDHYEGTLLDPTKDIGAEAYLQPYRWGPLTWEYKSLRYFNERTISIQQTFFSFVAQMRNWLPAPIGGIIWFGVDDFSCSPHAPIYAGTREVPWRWAYGLGSRNTSSLDAAFWVYNLLSNYAYQRYDQIHPDIALKILQIEDQFMGETAQIDLKAKGIYQLDPIKAVECVSDYSVTTANRLVEDWLHLFGQIFIKYMDGNVKTKSGGPIPNVSWPGYGENWYANIVTDTGSHYQFPKSHI